MLNKYLKGEHIIGKFQNHLLVDGVLYRGHKQRTLVKPVNGKYKIRYRGEENFYTLDELLGINKKPSLEIEKKKYIPKRNRCETMTSVCKEFGTNPTTAKKWFTKNSIIMEVNDLEKLRDQMRYRTEMIRKKQLTSVPNLCKMYDVDYRGYQVYLRKLKLQINELSRYGHEKMIQEFKDSIN